jgi:hypothetical protein
MLLTEDVTETTATLLGAVVAAVAWWAWAFFSETRHQHGFWVALLMPLAPVIIPALWIIFISNHYLSRIIHKEGRFSFNNLI